MKQQPEQFESNKQTLHQVPETLIPNMLAQLGLEGTRKSANDSLASLIENLRVDDWQTRLIAVEALDRQTGPIPVEPLLRALHDEDASVRAVAVRMLGKLDNSDAMTGLEAALHDPDWHVRETAVFVLGQHISPPVEILTMAQHDEDIAVRRAATMMLQDIQIENTTMQPLPASATRHIHSHTLLSSISDYKNYTQLYIQRMGDKMMQREQVKSNRLDTTPQQQDSKEKQHPVMHALEAFIAVAVVLSIVGSWFALTHGVHTSTQGHRDTTVSNKGAFFYHQDEMTPEVYWTSNSKYIYIHDQQEKVLHFINVVTKQVTTIANPDKIAQTTTGKIAALTPDGLSVCTVDDTGSMLHVQVQAVITKKVEFDAFYPKLANINTSSNFQWSNDSTHIAISSNDGTITLLNVRTKQQPVVLKGANVHLNVVTWSQDDQQILATTSDGLVLLWNAPTGKRTLDIRVSVYATGTYSLQLSPDGKHIAFVPNDQTIQILDATTGAKLFTYQDAMDSQNIDFVWLDNTHIISVNEDISPGEQYVQIWNIATGRTTLDVPIAANSRWNTSYNNKYVVTQAPNATTSQVWNAITGREVTTHTSSSVYLPSSSPNEKYFITTAGGDDNKIDIWSAITGKTVAIYRSSDPSLVSAQYSPDGKYLLAISTNGRTNPVGTTLDVWQMSN